MCEYAQNTRPMGPWVPVVAQTTIGWVWGCGPPTTRMCARPRAPTMCTPAPDQANDTFYSARRHDVTGGLCAMKALYYGDNLQMLRDSIVTESVDLIYLDPPFNTKATYNVRCWRVSRPRFRAAACPLLAKRRQ